MFPCVKIEGICYSNCVSVSKFDQSTRVLFDELLVPDECSSMVTQCDSTTTMNWHDGITEVEIIRMIDEALKSIQN